MLSILKQIWLERRLGWREVWRRLWMPRVHLDSGTYVGEDWSNHVVIVDGGAEVVLDECTIDSLDVLHGSVSWPRTEISTLELCSSAAITTT